MYILREKMKTNRNNEKGFFEKNELKGKVIIIFAAFVSA
jgi:hypothetical protein